METGEQATEVLLEAMGLDKGLDILYIRYTKDTSVDNLQCYLLLFYFIAC